MNDMTTPPRTERRRNGVRTSPSDRGAVLLFTVLGMVGLLSFSALAIDIGMRNQLLARDQNAIDSAALAAAYEIAVSGGSPDYDKASALVKEMIQQNLGIDSSTGWIGCEDPDHLAIIAPADAAISNECISFGLNAAGEYVARVILPPHSIETIFGGVTGTESLRLSATAGADGNECPPLHPGCGGAGTTTTTTTTPVTTTTFDTANWCINVLDEYNLVVKYWGTCGGYHPGIDRNTWWTEWCVATNPPTIHTLFGGSGGPDVEWTLYWSQVYMDHWDECRDYSNNSAQLQIDRAAWLPAHCNDYHQDWAFNAGYHGWSDWDDCIVYWGPAYTNWVTANTTTTSPTTTGAPTTTAAPTTTVPAPPTSIDINI